jgi:hypothetical protein
MTAETFVPMATEGQRYGCFFVVQDRGAMCGEQVQNCGDSVVDILFRPGRRSSRSVHSMRFGRDDRFYFEREQGLLEAAPVLIGCGLRLEDKLELKTNLTTRLP